MNDDSTHKQGLLRRIAGSKYLRREAPPRSVREIILWWELRRVPFNLSVGVVGLVTSIICFASIIILSLKIPDVELMPDPPLFAIIGVILYAIGANVCYTGGWIVEVALYWFSGKGDTYFGPVTFVLGMVFSVLLTLFPALFFVGYAIVTVFAPTP